MAAFRQFLPMALLALIAAPASAWDGVFVPAPDYTDEAEAPATTPAATLLQDGRVAIVDGWGVYVFDPAHSTVARVATLPFSLPGAPFTSLPDGKALLIGDFCYTNNRGIVFDPADNSVIATPNLATPRVAPSVTPLADGRVMIAGGCADDICATPLASTEIYDSATGTFSPGPSMLQRRAFHSATLLADGRVLFYGGKGYGASAPDGGYLSALDTAELYDPATNSFKYTRNRNGDQTYMWWSRSYHTGSAMPNGKVLLCGGHQTGAVDYGVAYSCDIFVIATGEIISRPGVALPYGSGAMDHTATVLADGTLLIAGGIDNMWPIPKASARIYDPVTKTVHEVSGMTHALSLIHI